MDDGEKKWLFRVVDTAGEPPNMSHFLHTRWACTIPTNKNQVANALIQAAQAGRLLGAQIILTRIGPTMAQTLAHLGADLHHIQMRRSLQRAVVEALEHS